MDSLSEAQLGQGADGVSTLDAGIGYFDEYRASNELFQPWRKQYGDDPSAMFAEDNAESLRSLSAGQRLCYLGWASFDIRVTPELLRQHFDRFPEDLEAIESLFVRCQGFSRSNYEQKIFSLAAPFFRLKPVAETDRPTEASYYKKIYGEIAARRNEAPKYLLDNLDHRHIQGFKDFGPAGEVLVGLLREANELSQNGDHFLEVSRLFGPQYQAMPDKMKAVFLRKCLAEIQYEFVAQETYASEFTSERVEGDNQRARKPQVIGGLRLHSGMYHANHSILFNTYQASKNYDTQQSEFEKRMVAGRSHGSFVEEYPFHRLALAVIDELGSIEHAEKEETVDVLVDFWSKNRNPLFANATARALSSQHPERAAGKLMELVGNDRSPNKNALAAILYRLEFGRMGISQDGVQYLERQYDLGEFNNPEYFVNRLTAQGDIGIFDENAALVRHFNLGDLTSDERNIRAAVLGFTYETLFTPRANETPEERERRERILAEFKQNYFDFAKSPLFKDADVQLNNLSFKEQGWLLHFYETADEETRGRLTKLIQTHGESGLRACLALEHGEEFRETILVIGEKLPAEVAKAFFGKYGQIMDVAFAAGQEAAQLLGERHQVTAEEQEKIYQQLSERARDLMMRVSRQTDLTAVAVNEVLDELDQVQASILLFAATFRVVSEKDAISLEDIRDTKIEIVATGQFSVKDRETMLSLFKNVREHDHYSDVHIAALESGLKEVLEGGKGRFYVVRHSGEIIAFVRFEDLDNGHVYAGSFTASQDIRGSTIGSALIQTAFAEENADRTLEAIVFSGNPRLMEYHTKVLGHEILRDQTLTIGDALYYKMIRRPQNQPAESFNLAA